MNRRNSIFLLLTAALLLGGGCHPDKEPQPTPEENPTLTAPQASPEEPGSMRMEDIKPPVLPPFKYGRILRMLFFIALAALLIGLLARLLAQRKRNPKPKPAPPPPPAHETALAALARLEQSGWMERGEAYPFYSELSQIWRHYLEDHFRINAPEKTTEELAAILQQHPVFPEQYRTLLCRFLTDADAVKFARERTGPEMMRASLALCREFVRNTRETDGESDPTKEGAA